MPKKKRPVPASAAVTSKPVPKPKAKPSRRTKPASAQPGARRMPAAGRQGPRSMEEEIQNSLRAQRPLVTLHDREGEVASIAVGADYQAVVNRWAYVLQSRRGWANRQATRDAQSQHALDELLRLGLSEGQLQRASGAGRIEVRIRDADARSTTGEQYSVLFARRVPWEYLLSGATGALGRQQPISITRHLPAATDAAATPAAPAAARAPQTLLYLQSAPSPIDKEFDFDSESRVVRSTLGFIEADVAQVINPDLELLGAAIRTRAADVIHVAGVDVHQARSLLGPKASIDDSRDGLVMKGERGALASVPGDLLAQVLVHPATPPLLVGFNLHHSSAELAAEAVARGARAAIGFQDEIDDETAEFFFAALYREWRRAHWNLFEAFSAAWRSLRGSIAHLHGTGIVLWSATSAFEAPAVPATADEAETAGATPRRGRPGAARPTPAPVAVAAAGVVSADTVIVSVEIEPEINYGLLHNGLPVFRKLTLHKAASVPALPVEVTVELNVGSDSYPYRHSFKLEDQPMPLADKVKVPLTSSLARALRERVQSTLYLRVKADETVVHQRTERVTLLPVDEWLDDGKQSVWLPSFVLPRDASIGRIVDAAQRYLMALLDDPAAGFDGYQQVDPNEAQSTAVVDLQVRALWCALSYDFGLSYINPPPSYSARTQRLRTPSDVINGKRGTCIDLALLLAACLEYVDIYPAVILLKGHAFPAYWRSAEAHENFVLANTGSPPPGTTGATTAGSTGTVGRYGWHFQRQHFAQIMQSVQRGDLVPLETVDITSRASFDTAMQDGLENLRNKNEFDSLLDLLQARRNEPPVTPLPIIQSER
jgi:hypothetical protein